MKIKNKFWYRWMLDYSFGELLGIGVAATIGRFLFMSFTSTQESQTLVLPFVILVVAGATEGSIIGFIQWRSLSKLIIDIKPLVWITITTLAGIAGWVFILPPAVVFISFFSSLKLISNYYSILYAALAGMAFGSIIGIPQFFIIKKFYKKALVWIFATALGWSLSFLIIYAALQMFAYTTSFIHNLLIIISSCVLSGLIQGIVTGTSIHFFMIMKLEHKQKSVDV